MTSSYSPLCPPGAKDNKTPVWDLVQAAFNAVNFRGKVTSKEANENIQKLKQRGKVHFVEWMPTGFKVGLNEIPCMDLKDDILQKTNKTCAMIGNNVAVNRVFTERLAKKYDMMYSQRAYVHWYVGEGME